MSFPVLTSGGGQIGTGLIYSNVVYFYPYSPTVTNITRTVSWTVPAGVTTVRVRVWGGGGGGLNTGNGLNYSGGGGGFALKTITGLTPGSTVTVTISAGGNSGSSPAIGGTSSFGAYVSATGGRNNNTAGSITGGVGVGGDINMYGSGGGPLSSTTNSGHAGNLFIPFTGVVDEILPVLNGAYPILMSSPVNGLDKIGTGFLFGQQTAFSFFGSNGNPVLVSLGNGQGSGSGAGTFPGGGGWGQTQGGQAAGAPGLVVVEY